MYKCIKKMRAKKFHLINNVFSQINEPAHNLLKALKSHRNLAKMFI